MSYYEFVVRRPTLHDIALIEAERFNPGGEHCVTGVEIDGEVDEPGDAVVTVATRVPAAAALVNVKIRSVPLT